MTFFQKQEQQIVFAADLTRNNSLPAQVYSVRQTSELMAPDFQGFDVSSSSSLLLKVQMNLLLTWFF